MRAAVVLRFTAMLVATACASPSPSVQPPVQAQDAPPVSPSTTAARSSDPAQPKSAEAGAEADLPDEPPAARAPASERTLSRLVKMVASPDTTLQSYRQRFGTVDKRTPGTRSFEFVDPFDDASRLTVSGRNVQNRRYLSGVAVHFRKDVGPTISDVARRLGARVPQGPIALRHTCSHGPCPRATLSFASPSPVDASLSIAVEGFSMGGRFIGPFDKVADPKTKRVAGLSLQKAASKQCVAGEPLSGHDRVTLIPPATARDRDFAAAIAEAATALAKVPIDLPGIERALGITLPRGDDRFKRRRVPIGAEPQATWLAPLFEVIWDANRMSGYHWLLLMARDERMPPLRLSGLHYVDDPKVLCAYHEHDAHLYEVPASGGAKLTVEVHLRRDFRTGAATISHIELERAPSGKDPRPY
jgi:hypothetical protein